MFEDLAARVKLDEEEAARIKKERDELVRKDVKASKRATEVLSELETERDLRREAEDRSSDLQRRADQDAVLIYRLRRERDEARKAEERLRSEHSTAHEERDRAIRERDEARQEVESLRTELGTTVARRLEVEEAAVGLRADLADARGLLQAEGDEYDRLSFTVLVVCDNLQVAQEEGTSSLAARAAGITSRVGHLEESAFHAGITQAFTIAHSHYEKEINLSVMSEGFPLLMRMMSWT